VSAAGVYSEGLGVKEVQYNIYVKKEVGGGRDEE
jgi:hypothetical protein